MVSDNKYESMLLVQAAVIASVLLVRQLYIMWRQKKIYDLLHCVGIYSIQEIEDFNVVNNKLNSYMKWNTYFYSFAIVVSACVTLLVAFIGSEKNLFLNVVFPLDYKKSDIAYWIAFLFVFSELCLVVISISFSIITWYLLFNCCLKYKILGSELRNMGVITKVDAAVKKLKISELEKQKFFYRYLTAGIESLTIQAYTIQVSSET